MSGFLGLQDKNPQGQQNLLLYGYENPPVDILTDSDITTTQIGELGMGPRFGRSRTTVWTPTRSTGTCSMCRSSTGSHGTMPSDP